MNPTLPTFSPSRVILAPKGLRYNPCDDVIFPSIFRAADHLRQALGKYYLYYAPHDAPGGICLATADALDGPWKEYGENPIITRQWEGHYQVSHISSPHALWMPGESRLFLYFHGENDTTRLATSIDGIHFDYQSAVVTTQMYDGISESSYARVFPCNVPGRDARHVMLFMGNNGGTRRIYAAWSRDGRHFEPQKTPLISPPPGTAVTQCGGPWYWPINGRNYVIFHGDQTPPDLSNLSTDLYIADVGANFDEETHLGLFYPRQAAGEANRRVSDPSVVEEDGKRWLFTAVGGRLHQAIAVAEELSNS